MKNNIWLSYSDLMSCLMIVFLFISISYIKQEHDKSHRLSELNERLEQEILESEKKTIELEKYKSIQSKKLTEYYDSRTLIYNELCSVFEKELIAWNMEIDKNLIIRFSTPEVMFEVGQSSITPKFQEILNDFIPKYLSIMLQDKYRKRIKEIRIEGHTDTTPIGNKDPDPYMSNMRLSHERSLSVLKTIRSMNYYQTLSENEKKLLQFWFTANGLSYGHALDNNKKEVFLTKNPINLENSRRVEFRVVTTSEELIEDMYEVVDGKSL